MPSRDDDVRLAEDAKVYVYVKDASGTWVKGSNKVIVHAGDYILADPKPVKK